LKIINALGELIGVGAQRRLTRMYLAMAKTRAEFASKEQIGSLKLLGLHDQHDGKAQAKDQRILPV
jgi:hypothetical protein